MAQMNKRSYFGAARRGELAENRAGLNSNYVEERKDAIKRVIANMTVGKVSILCQEEWVWDTQGVRADSCLLHLRARTCPYIGRQRSVP